MWMDILLILIAVLPLLPTSQSCLRTSGNNSLYEG
jgi:hypothetical protein